MNREEKLKLIKEVSTGNIQALKELKNKNSIQEKDSWTVDLLIRAFKYLAKHGPIESFYLYRDEARLSLSDLTEFMDSINKMIKMDFDSIPDKQMSDIGQCFDCLEFFKKNNQLHLLAYIDTDKKINTDIFSKELYFSDNPSTTVLSKNGWWHIKGTDLFFSYKEFQDFQNEYLKGEKYKHNILLKNGTDEPGIDWPEALN